MKSVDFSLVLTLIVIVTGVVSLFGILRRSPAHTITCSHHKKGFSWINAKKSGIVGFCRSLFPVIFIILLIRSFVVEPFQIPSGSMSPALKPGDFILVNKFAYGLYLPVTHTKLVSTGTPQRGDVIVFKRPMQPGVHYIKRIIGLPGDHIVYENHHLIINNIPVINKPLTSLQKTKKRSVAETSFNVTEETLGDHVFHIQTSPGNEIKTVQETKWTVPPGMYFVMGDNRDQSYDSRYWGFVPEKNITGKAFYLWMHWLDWHHRPVFKYNCKIT